MWRDPEARRHNARLLGLAAMGGPLRGLTSDVELAPIGRHLPERTDLHNLPLGEIVYHLTGRRLEQLLEEIGQPATLEDFDANDLHVLAAAVDGVPRRSAPATRPSTPSSG